MAVKDYIRERFFPHIWCAGCGHGNVLSALLRAVEQLSISKNEIVGVSGIGCSSRITGYVDFHTLHTIHGRALAFATGVKMSRPELNLIVTMGDGDALAIGGNHFIHAARRNMDLTILCVNNFNYGMTGGQLAPSTPYGAKTTTTPMGSPDEPFNFCALAAACGATYVARWTALHVRRLTNAIKEAIDKKGFSFIEVIAPCPTAFGRRNKIRKPLDLLRFYYDRSVVKNNLNPGEATIDFDHNLAVGKFLDIERPTFLDHYEMVNRGEVEAWPATGVDASAAGQRKAG